jgi:hypothetical protein
VLLGERLFKGSKALKLRPTAGENAVGETTRKQRISRETRLFEGRKALKGAIPRTLEPERWFRGFWRRKPLRG